jgi:hypothetical protein
MVVSTAPLEDRREVATEKGQKDIQGKKALIRWVREKDEPHFCLLGC